MIQRRLAWAIGACFVVVGCGKSEATPPSTTGIDEGKVAQQADVPFVAASTSKGSELLGRARSIFKTTAVDANNAIVSKSALPVAQIDELKTDGVSYLAIAETERFKDRQVSVRLPKLGDGVVQVEAMHGMKIEVKPKGFAPTPIEWAENVAVHPDVAPGVQAFRVVKTDGVEDLYQVEAPRETLEFSYDVRLTNVAGLRLVEGSLEMLDASGNPLLRAPEPVVFDSKGVARVGKMYVSGCAYDTSVHGPWGRKVTAPGASTCTVVAKIDGRGLSYPVLVDPTWQGTGNTKQQHAYHKLILLQAGPDAGKVVLVGGIGTAPTVTELFNPTTNTWAAASSLPSTPTEHTFGIGGNAVGMPDGTIVATGGFPATGATSTAQGKTATRNPTTGNWTSGAVMTSRAWHGMAAVKVDGKDMALVVGGQPTSFLGSTSLPLKNGEYYDPATDNWFSAGSMSSGRTKAGVAVMGNGQVIVAGGENYNAATFTTQFLNTSDIWNPTSKNFTGAAAMVSARTNHQVVSLGGAGKTWAIAAGGNTSTSVSTMLSSIEFFDGTSWKLISSPMGQQRQFFASALLDNGSVLLTGGQTLISTFSAAPTDSADIFIPGADPGTTGTVAGASTMSTARAFHAMVTLPGKGALVAGGQATTSAGSETTSSELFNTAIGGPCGAGCGAGLTCVEGVCCTSASCPAGQTCKAPGREGVCTKPKGAACGSNLECATGYCVTGFCCENACSTGCKACNEKGKEGTCVLAPAGTNPGAFCSGDVICGLKCDGTGKCGTAYAPMGTPCGASASDAGTGSFCTISACTSFGSCSSTTNNCGLTCTTTVTCNEATKTCTPVASGIKAGFCVIDAACYAYGDINPKNACQVCDPPTNKTAWSTAVSCMDGGVVDTGVEDLGVKDTGSSDAAKPDTSVKDTGSMDSGTEEDTAAPEDTAPAVEDTSTPPPVGADLPEGKACSCRTAGGNESNESALVAGFAMLGLAVAIGARRRR